MILNKKIWNLLLIIAAILQGLVILSLAILISRIMISYLNVEKSKFGFILMISSIPVAIVNSVVFGKLNKYLGEKAEKG